MGLEEPSKRWPRSGLDCLFRRVDARTWKTPQKLLTAFILFESGNMAHTQTHKDIQTDRTSKKEIV